jgi:hypothetical protein
VIGIVGIQTVMEISWILHLRFHYTCQVVDARHIVSGGPSATWCFHLPFAFVGVNAKGVRYVGLGWHWKIRASKIDVCRFFHMKGSIYSNKLKDLA